MVYQSSSVLLPKGLLGLKFCVGLVHTTPSDLTSIAQVSGDSYDSLCCVFMDMGFKDSSLRSEWHANSRATAGKARATILQIADYKNFTTPPWNPGERVRNRCMMPRAVHF